MFPALTSFVTPGNTLWIVAAVAVAVGLLLGAVHREFAEPGVGVKVSKGLGIVLASGGLFLLVSGLGKPTAALAWEHGDVEAAQERALRENKPLLVDFTAAWCSACKQLDRETFSVPAVGRELGRFVTVKVDATHDDDPKVEATLSRSRARSADGADFRSSGREACVTRTCAGGALPREPQEVK